MTKFIAEGDTLSYWGVIWSKRELKKSKKKIYLNLGWWAEGFEWIQSNVLDFSMLYLYLRQLWRKYLSA